MALAKERLENNTKKTLLKKKKTDTLLVGLIEAYVSRLLMWCLACCLELLGFLENAAALFATRPHFVQLKA